MNSKTLLAAVSVLAISSYPVLAKPGIDVVGNGKVDAEYIVSVFPEKKSFSAEDVDTAVKELFSTGAFSDVRISRKGSRYVVTVKETPVVANIVFSGNKRLKDEQLEIGSGLNAGSPLDPSRLPEAVKRIEDIYAATGRRNVRVTTEVVNRDLGFYDVMFKVDEGDRSTTSDVWFDGNTSFSSLRLRSVISTKRTGVLSKLFSRDVLDAAKLEEDRRKIEAFYRSHGFADVVVSEAEVDFDPEGKNGMAGFRIVEGPHYTVGNVSIDNGTDVAVPAAVLSEAKVLSGTIYDESLAAKSAERLAKALEDAGVAAVDVTARTNRLPGGVVDVSFAVDVRQKVYVERIEIVGNERTKDYVIRREIDLAEGDLLNLRLVREAERRLKRLGFFESVRLASGRGSADDRVVLRVEVAERKTGEFSIGGAYSTADGPMAILSVTQSNFGGTGRAISASVGRGTETSNYDFSFTEPYIFGNRLSATTQVFRRSFDAREGGFRPFDETVDGLRLSLKGPISANSDLSVNYSISRFSKDSIEDRFAPLVVNGDRVVSAVGYDWFYSSLDDEKNPSNGLKANFGQQFAGLGGDAAFVKTEASARAYHELSQRHEIIGSVAVRAGHVAGIGEELSFEDHFRSVAELVRGFESGGLGPRDLATGYLLGGQYYAGASAEAVYPIPVLSDGLGIKGSIFADVGSIWGADSDSVSSSGATARFDSASIRAAIGTGIVWDSPLGLFKANFALPVSSEDGDREQVFSISGGTRF